MMRYHLEGLGDLWAGEFAEVVAASHALAAVGARAGLVVDGRSGVEEDRRIQLSMRRAHGDLRIVVSLTAQPEGEPPAPLRAGLQHYRAQCVSFADAGSAARAGEIVGELRGELARFSRSDLRRIAKLNPLVLRAGQCYGRVDFGRTAVVLCDHPLLEKLNMLRVLLDLGLPPERCVVVFKRDRTQYRDQVCGEIARLGVGVFTAERMADAVSAVAAMRPRQLVILDDGGSVIRALGRAPSLASTWVAPIETTTKGIRLLRAELPELELLDLASCSIKRELAQEIAVSCVLRFRALMQHERVAGERCVVIGYGQLGTHVADVLAALGTRVSVVDVDADRRALASARGHRTHDSLSSALRAAPHRFLFGCSGVPSVTTSDLQLMPSPRVLATVSSQDLALVQDALRRRDAHEGHAGLGDVYVGAHGEVTTVLGHGDAVNLYLSEGVSEPEFDPFTALLLIAVVEVGRAAAYRPALRSFDVENWCKRVNALRAGGEAPPVQQPGSRLEADLIME